ncbi:Hypothetical protein PAU_01204 [Photorhabdus asymbiotica]|uniref:Cysteine synthase n=1 Tax=Photorhabdus asymbiotica subsp. asymbiotica (strain ATCC 43949 / 3105-77) TaxID=553480 RepID=B6VKD9_PHOAA|nr:Hypothetical protein PAU_01204 [Photorhabdus asymbiotica]CAR66619.1 Hypothetical protein PA-RVA2-4281 [Photorhabdus asymbiotica subsp. asymbiotica ATCC 43949]
MYPGWIAGSTLLMFAQKGRKGKRIVTIVPDSGLKYLSKFYDDNWMKSAEYTKDK